MQRENRLNGLALLNICPETNVKPEDVGIGFVCLTKYEVFTTRSIIIIDCCLHDFLTNHV